MRRARSSLLPTVETSATLLQIDPEAAERAFGQQPERTGKGTGTVQQVLFSEPVLANLEIQRYLAEAARHRADLVALDLVLNLATAYFDILLAKTAGRIQDENLEASRRNLKIARTRHAVGYAGVADVYRWESEVARATQSSIQAFNNLYLAKVQLNRLLNRADIGEEFEVEDAALSDDLFGGFDPARMGDLIRRAGDVEILTDFLVEEALANMPSLKQLEANMKAAGRRQRMNYRQYFLPSVVLRGAGRPHLLARRQGDAARPRRLPSMRPGTSPFTSPIPCSRETSARWPSTGRRSSSGSSASRKRACASSSPRPSGCA